MICAPKTNKRAQNDRLIRVICLIISVHSWIQSPELQTTTKSANRMWR